MNDACHRFQPQDWMTLHCFVCISAKDWMTLHSSVFLSTTVAPPGEQNGSVMVEWIRVFRLIILVLPTTEVAESGRSIWRDSGSRLQWTINSINYAVPAIINITSSDNGATSSDAELSFIGYVVCTWIKIVVNYVKKSIHIPVLFKRLSVLLLKKVTDKCDVNMIERSYLIFTLCSVGNLF